MAVITPEKYLTAQRWQQGLGQGALLARCDELFVQQRLVFLELLTFQRDGATEAQVMEMLALLSVLQRLALDHGAAVGRPIEEAEFSEGAKRAFQYFASVQSEDAASEKRGHQAWLKGVQINSEPVLWSGLLSLMTLTRMDESPLFQSMAVTLYALVDCYSRRFREAGPTSPATQG